MRTHNFDGCAFFYTFIFYYNIKMIVLYWPFEQTSNQFIQHISIDAFCRENRISYCNPFFYKYKQDYPYLKLLKENWLTRHALFFTHLKKIGLAQIINFDDDNANVKDRIYDPNFYRNKLIYCWGWNFRVSDLVAKYRDDYKKQFYPNNENLIICNSILNTKIKGQVLLGIHIRRGDYLTFADGKYYYDDATYIRYIEQMQNLIGKDCKIIIFSNDENLNSNLYFEKFKDIYISKHSVAVDHYLMSQCDFLLGPPSTFTAWASFIGTAKCCHIEDKEQELTLEMFRNFDRL